MTLKEVLEELGLIAPHSGTFFAHLDGENPDEEGCFQMTEKVIRCDGKVRGTRVVLEGYALTDEGWDFVEADHWLMLEVVKCEVSCNRSCLKFHFTLK